MQYAFRKSAFEKEKTYELTKEGIEVTDHEGTKTMNKYTDVVQVNTSFGASKSNSFYQCELKMANGFFVLLKSQHYRGIADFEDRNKEYSTFVKGLHKILATANPNVIYKKGIGMFGYIASMIIFIVSGLIFTIVSISMLITGKTWFGIIGIIASALLILKMVNYSKKNKPGKYTPENIPANLLPAVN